MVSLFYWIAFTFQIWNMMPQCCAAAKCPSFSFPPASVTMGIKCVRRSFGQECLARIQLGRAQCRRVHKCSDIFICHRKVPICGCVGPKAQSIGKNLPKVRSRYCQHETLPTCLEANSICAEPKTKTKHANFRFCGVICKEAIKVRPQWTTNWLRIHKSHRPLCKYGPYL